MEIMEPQERSLGLELLKFDDVIEQVADEAYPHILCNYLFELSASYMKFYEACPMLKEGVTDTIRDSRLQLSRCVADTLRIGLDLLGIEVMDRM